MRIAVLAGRQRYEVSKNLNKPLDRIRTTHKMTGGAPLAN